jgi:hypothetical protein
MRERAKTQLPEETPPSKFTEPLLFEHFFIENPNVFTPRFLLQKWRITEHISGTNV